MPNISSKTVVAGNYHKNVLMNGAYVRSKTLEDVETLAKSASGAIVVGSISIKPRQSNPGPGYWLHKERFFSLNSFGLPNGGAPYYKNHLPKMVEVAHAYNKPLVANLIGFTPSEFTTLIKLAEESGADMAELNFGCPNVWDEGSQKQIISYHAPMVKQVLDAVRQQQPKIKLCIKISPLPPDILGEVSQVIANSGVVHAVTAVNSYPNASVTAGTKGPDGDANMLVGLAGRGLKPISVGVVKQLRALLPADIDIIGAGGVYTANDVEDYISAGSKAVQIASALMDEGPSVFEKIIFQSKTAG